MVNVKITTRRKVGRDARGNNQALHQLILVAAVPTHLSERSSFIPKVTLIEIQVESTRILDT